MQPETTNKPYFIMKIKVTKTFASFMNKAAEKHNVKFFASVVNLTDREYSCHFGMWADGDIDYDWNTGLFKAIAVSYPGEYFAGVRYVGTTELVKECRKRNIKTFEELEKMIVEMFEI